MKPKAEFAAAVLGGVAAAGLALYAASRTWLVEEGLRPAPLPPLGIEHSGGELVPALPAFALVGLAGVGALLATRGLPRLVVAILVLGAGVGTLAGGYVGWQRYGGGWAAAATGAGAVLAAAGALALLRGRGWPVMGARYDRPRSPLGSASTAGPPAGSAIAVEMARASTRGANAGPGSASAVELWDAIERGEDPTGGPSRT